MMDASTVSNDSGVADSSLYQQQPFQFLQPSQFQVPHQTVPIFYAQSPVPQTTQIAPIFPVPQLGQIHHVNSAPSATSASTDRSPSRQVEESIAANNETTKNA